MTRIPTPRPRRSSRWQRLSRLAAYALVVPVLLGAAGCEETPETRLDAFRAAADDEDLATYTDFFTARSAALIRGVAEVRERTKLKYLSEIFSLIPPGDVQESLLDGNMAVLTVSDGSKTGKIRMLKEDGQWLIDIMDDKKIWAPLSSSGDL